jgi:hypothetical protein
MTNLYILVDVDQPDVDQPIDTVDHKLEGDEWDYPDGDPDEWDLDYVSGQYEEECEWDAVNTDNNEGC